MFKTCSYLLMVLFCMSLQSALSAQKKVVVMGSSTAMGPAATSTALSWVGRMRTHYQNNATDGLDTSFQLVGGYGYVTYNQMPGSFTPPPGRPPHIPGYNVDQALSLTPDIIVINLPNNDVASGFTKKEVMDNLRYLYSYIMANGTTGIQCYICTSQPRNDLPFAQRDSLRTLKDSILLNFGNYAINFWDDLVTNDGQYLLKDEVRHIGFPDADYHLNNQGHLVVFQEARDKNIFSPNILLPVIFKNFLAQKHGTQTRLSWQVEAEEAFTIYQVERSTDGQHFTPLHTRQAQVRVGPVSYTWTDDQPAIGKNLYRIKITENNMVRYSPVMAVIFEEREITIDKLYLNNGFNALVMEIHCRKSQKTQISIRNTLGVITDQCTYTITAPFTTLNIPLTLSSSGLYFITVTDENGKSCSKAFIR